MKMTTTILFVCTLLQITQVYSVKRVFNATRISDRDVQPPRDTAGGLKSTVMEVPTLLPSGREITIQNPQDERLRGARFASTPKRQTRGLMSYLLSFLDGIFSVIGKLEYLAYSYTISIVRFIVYFPFNILKFAFQLPKKIIGFIISRATGLLTGESETELRILRVGKFILRPTVLALETVINISHMAKNFGPKLLRKILKSAGLTLKEFYVSVNALELPGWGYVLYLPNKVVNVVDTTKGKVVKIISKGGEKIRAGEAFLIFQFLKVIARKTNIVISGTGQDCYNLKSKSIPLKNPVVHAIVLGRLQLCGLSKFNLLNTVNVWKNTEDSLIIQAYFVNEQLTANATNSSVLGFEQVKLLDNEQIAIKMERMAIAAQVMFKKGTLVEFVKLRLRIVELKGFQMKILNKNKRTEMMDIIENLSPVVGKGVKSAINSRLQDLGRFITEDIKKNPR